MFSSLFLVKAAQASLEELLGETQLSSGAVSSSFVSMMENRIINIHQIEVGSKT